MKKTEIVWKKETQRFNLQTFREQYPSYDRPDSEINDYPSFEEIKDENKHAEVKESCMDSECAKCIMCCLEDAISMDGRVLVDKSKCSGCGLCVRMCPEHKLELVW